MFLQVVRLPVPGVPVHLPQVLVAVLPVLLHLPVAGQALVVDPVAHPEEVHPAQEEVAHLLPAEVAN